MNTPTGGAHFPRRARLTGRNAFTSVFAQSTKSSDRYFTVLTRSNDLGYPRLGLAVSRKVAKLAVTRNRLKRIARESFRHCQQELGGLDCVVLARPGASEQANAVLFTSLARHWQRVARSCVPSSLR